MNINAKDWKGVTKIHLVSGVLSSALLSAKIVQKATLKVCKGAPHGMCTTHKNQVNEDLLAFFKT
jgi:hypothetical protein